MPTVADKNSGFARPAMGRRAVVIGGVRTPFVKAFAEYLQLDTIAKHMLGH